MRAIAALLVVLSHVAIKGTQYSSDPLAFFRIGGVGVDLFFIISGYIMCHTVSDKRIVFREFLWARAKRIMPLYWVLTSTALVVYLLFPDKVNSSGGTTNIIYSYLLFPSPEKFLIQNGWTLSYEFYFYLIFSLCLPLAWKLKFLVPVFVILGLVLIGSIISVDTYQVVFATNTLLLEFAFGICSYYFFKYKSLSISISILLIFASIISLYTVNENSFKAERVLAYGLPAFMFFMGMIGLEGWFRKFKRINIFLTLKRLGDSSYSLYLIHPFTLVICSIILSKLGLNENGGLFSLILFLSALVSGHVCYLLIERNIPKVMRQTSHASKFLLRRYS